jgi:hypothetical protein
MVPVWCWHGDDVIGCNDDVMLMCAQCGMELTWHKWNGTHAPPIVQQTPMGPGSNGTTTSCAAAHGNFTFPLHPWAFSHGNMMSAQGNLMSIWGGSGGDGKRDAIVGDCNVIKHEHGCKFQLVDSSSISHGVTHATWYWQIISVGSSYGK